MAVSFAAEGAVGYITLDKPPANTYDFDSWRRWPGRSRRRRRRRREA